ncbi:MAG: NUDIX hydrolase [Armatimonadota bacterium]|nr:NUDIX hydrolase [Armatimonadota bacterium]MDR7464850.1 NUDIX hydrolase [Armatimonadota bacterium]MDR7469916.1 NUDIX hydrolase [Armatimonadota bacterium]MDR7474601.1 NUDIX hydrolase [Armatimonadota bacterium]MDR7539844.1 NUDIX hydrolase [Armatimonadota bacterium]
MPERVEVIARVAAADAQGRILVTQRVGRDYWVLPGGHADPGEALPAAARREAAEEAGVPVEVGPLLCVWEVLQGERRLLQCAFLGRLHGAVAAAETVDRGPSGGARRRCLVAPGELGTLRLFPAALAAPGFQARLRRYLRVPQNARDPYLGMEGATHLALPHRLNARVILAQEGRLLLVSDDREAFWVLPGGPVQAGERLEEVLVRETAEETGFRVVPERLLYLGEFIDAHLGEHRIEAYFLGQPGGGALRMGAETGFCDVSTARCEVTRARWFPRDALAGVTVYPEALRLRLWEDLAAPTSDLYLGVARPD